MNHREPSVTVVGGEDPIIARPYAYLPGGATHWTREAFEAAVPRDERWRWTIRREPESPSPAAQTPAPAPAPAPAQEAPARLAEGHYTLPGGVVLTVTAAGEVVDAWGNWLFYAPATEAELARQWQGFCECGE